jgi:hypothetical protein
LKLLHSFSAKKSGFCLPNVQLFRGTEGGKISGIKLSIGYKPRTLAFKSIEIIVDDFSGWTPILSPIPTFSSHKPKKKHAGYNSAGGHISNEPI